MVWETLDPALDTIELKEDWAARKAKGLALRRLELMGGAPRAVGTGLASAMKRYFDDHPRLSEETLTLYRSATNKFLAWATKAGLESVDDLVVQDVLNFFEDLGTMLRSRYLEVGPTWQAFSVHTRHYWAAFGEKYVTDMRAKYADQTFYTEFEFLARRMDREERRRRRKKLGDLKLSSTAIAEFLEDECKFED